MGVRLGRSLGMLIRLSRLLEHVDFIGVGVKSTTLFIGIKQENLPLFFLDKDLGKYSNLGVGILVLRSV